MTDAPSLLRGKRIAVLGSGSGLGLAVAAEAEAAGAEVLGICGTARFDHLAELYRFDPTDPGAMNAVAQALPEGLDGLALFPGLPDAAPGAVLEAALAMPRRLAEALAPRMAPGAAIVARAAPVDGAWHKSLGMIRAGASLRPGQGAGFAARWGLDVEPVLAPWVAGWSMLAWTLSRAAAWPGLRVNAVTPAAPDGQLPPAAVAASGIDAAEGPRLAARAAVFLLSDLAQGLTGANLAADGGVSARIQTRLEGL
jgi:NAD(P)-dependent dehydrogenase (short-subunit alcohol dehydrogenase family)